MKTETLLSSLPFASKSEVGSLIASKNWSRHELGDPAEWNPLLTTTLTLMLESRFPVILYWGDDLHCFFNDAFRNYFGRDDVRLKSPGEKLKKLWPETYDVLSVDILAVKRSGESVFFEDRSTIIVRNDRLEESFWSFSYSPVRDLNGEVLGVLGITTETTAKVRALADTRASELKIRNLFIQAPVGLLILRGKERKIDFVNTKYLEITQRDASCVGKIVWDVLPELKTQGYDKLLDSVFDKGTRVHATEQQIRVNKGSELVTGYYNFSYEPVRKPDGSIDAVIAMVVDVTEQVVARQKVEYSEERLRLAIDAASLGTFDFDLITDRLEASDRFYQICGFVYKATHRGIVEVIHEDDRKVRERAHRRAYATGHLFYEARIVWGNGKLRWIRVHGTVKFDAERNPVRIIGVIQDITDDKELREASAVSR